MSLTDKQWVARVCACDYKAKDALTDELEQRAENIATLTAALAAARQDIVLAAGELLVAVPEPGTPMSRVMLANAAMRRQRNEAQTRAADMRTKLDSELERGKRLTEALRLALKYWEDRQQRYKNRHPAWVVAALKALEEV